MEEGNFSLLVLDGAYAHLEQVVPDKLRVCIGRPKGHKFENDPWRETPSQVGRVAKKTQPIIILEKKVKISGNKSIKYGIKKIKLN